MAKKDEAIPVEHGFGSAAAITASETGKGLLGGLFGGGWRGAIIGAVAGAVVLGGIGFLALGGAWVGMAALPEIGLMAGASAGALLGGAAGVGFGAPGGAAIGMARGIGRGIERVGRDSAAAQMARNQEMAAQAQMETAKALQGRIIERMSAPVPYPQPEPQVHAREYHGQGVAHVPHHAMGAGHAQRVHQEQLAQASAEPQVG